MLTLLPRAACRVAPQHPKHGTACEASHASTYVVCPCSWWWYVLPSSQSVQVIYLSIYAVDHVDSMIPLSPVFGEPLVQLANLLLHCVGPTVLVYAPLQDVRLHS